MAKEMKYYNQLRKNVEKEVMKVYDQTASVDEVVINIFELFEHSKEDIIDCPSCGFKWNTTFL